jgi:hypothetical protein
MNRDIQTTAIFTSYPSFTISTDGTGSGTVTSYPPGIACPTQCSAQFAPDTSLDLIATPARGSAFSRWNGVCTGAIRTCHGINAADTWATATFTKLPPPFPSHTLLLGKRSKTSGCHTRGTLPDRACSPGAIYSDEDQTQLCTPSYAARVRRLPLTGANAVFNEYNIPPTKRRQYKIDRLVPPDLGGSNDIANLRPQGTSGHRAKEKLEAKLYQLLCSNQFGLKTVQRAIASNWIVLYNHIFTISP